MIRPCTQADFDAICAIDLAASEWVSFQRPATIIQIGVGEEKLRPQ
jgi:hypothetical protein